MPHCERNIRLTLFLILPIFGFLLGWSLSQKTSEHQEIPVIAEIKPSIDTVDQYLVEELEPEIKLLRRNDKARDVDLSLFWETWNVLEENFLHKDIFKVESQIYGATKGLVRSLKDSYTVFMTPKETKEFEESISGEFEGVGAEIGIRKENLVIITPLKGSPAELAGIKAGDMIFKIDGETTHGISIEEAVTQIRGPKGEKVVLTILREEEKNPIDITIVRDNIVLKNLEWRMQEDVVVIAISQFGTDLVREFREAMPEILLQKPRGIILDLRNNGGGLLDACVKIVSEFLHEQVIVRTKGRKFGNSGNIMSGKDGAFLKTPVVVLINNGSASASEIFAGAIQDHHRGLVLGETSFGKGSVQNVVPLSDGSSLKVTIAEWLTPDGKSIHEEGIQPDEIIKLDSKDEESDPVLDRALELVGTEEMQLLLTEKETENEEMTEEVSETPSEKEKEEKDISSDEEVADPEE
jgi:carboxyl-terminal processing protease